MPALFCAYCNLCVHLLTKYELLSYSPHMPHVQHTQDPLLQCKKGQDGQAYCHTPCHLLLRPYVIVNTIFTTVEAYVLWACWYARVLWGP